MKQILLILLLTVNVFSYTNNNTNMSKRLTQMTDTEKIKKSLEEIKNKLEV